MCVCVCVCVCVCLIESNAEKGIEDALFEDLIRLFINNHFSHTKKENSRTFQDYMHLLVWHNFDKKQNNTQFTISSKE